MVSAELRAVGDAFIYDIAVLLHVAELLGEEGMEARCDATGWTTRQTLGHLVANYERYAALFGQRLAGEPIPPHGSDTDERNAMIAETERNTDPEVLLQRLQAARADIVQRLAAVSPAMERVEFGPGRPPLRELARAWSGHGASHAVDFLEAVPVLAEDAIVANWVFYPRDGEPASLHARRQTLLKQLRANAKKGG